MYTLQKVSKITDKIEVRRKFKKRENAKKDYLHKMSIQGSKQCWKYLRKSFTPSIPTLRTETTVASTNSEKAALLNQVLSQNFNYDIDPLSISSNYQFVVDLPQPVNLLQHLGKISVDSDLDANWKEEVESKVSSYVTMSESCEDDRLDIYSNSEGWDL